MQSFFNFTGEKSRHRLQVSTKSGVDPGTIQRLSHRNRVFIFLFELDILLPISSTMLGVSVETKIFGDSLNSR